VYLVRFNLAKNGGGTGWKMYLFHRRRINAGGDVDPELAPALMLYLQATLLYRKVPALHLNGLSGNVP
jgi:hypothetical protein